MCANYQPATPDQLRGHFGVAPPDTSYKVEAYPGYLAPIIRKPSRDAGVGERAAVNALFGLIPHWAERKLARSTYNARTETVAAKPSFRNAFKRGQFCIIPASVIFEPCYKSGHPVREAITLVDGAPLGIAGLWESKSETDGLQLISFSMLTINADEHPLMRRMHQPADEKRMVVILRPEQYDSWLHCPVAESAEFFTAFPAELLTAQSAPKPENTALQHSLPGT